MLNKLKVALNIRALKDFHKCSEAAQVLGEIGDTSAVEPLLEALHNSYLPHESVIEALGKLKDERAIAPLFATLADVAPAIRGIAARSLVKLGQKDIDTWIKGDDGDFVRAAQSGQAWAPRCIRNAVENGIFGAIGPLATFTDPRVTEILIAALAQGYSAKTEFMGAASFITFDEQVERRKEEKRIQEKSFRDEVVRVLGKRNDARAVPALLKALELSEKGWFTPQEVMQALSNFHEPCVISALIAIIEDDAHWKWSSPEARVEKQCYAAKVLGHFKEESAREVLIKALTSEPKLRCVAAESLAEMGEIKYRNAVQGNNEDLIRLVALEDVPVLRALTAEEFRPLSLRYLSSQDPVALRKLLSPTTEIEVLACLLECKYHTLLLAKAADLIAAREDPYHSRLLMKPIFLAANSVFNSVGYFKDLAAPLTKQAFIDVRILGALSQVLTNEEAKPRPNGANIVCLLDIFFDIISSAQSSTANTFFFQALQCPVQPVRRRAAWLLGQKKDPTTVPALVRAMLSEPSQTDLFAEREYRRRVVNRGGRGPEMSFHFHHDSQVAPLPEEEFPPRDLMRYILCHLDLPQALRELHEILNAAKTESSDIRIEAARELALLATEAFYLHQAQEQGEPGLMKMASYQEPFLTLINILIDDTDSPDVRSQIALSIISLSEENRLEAWACASQADVAPDDNTENKNLTALLIQSVNAKTEPGDVTCAMIAILGEIGDKRAVAALESITHSENTKFQFAAWEALGPLARRQPDAWSLLSHVLLSDVSRVRAPCCAVIRAVMKSHNTRASALIKRHVASPYEDIRKTASIAMSELGDTTWQSLVSGKDDDYLKLASVGDAEVNQAICDALTRRLKGYPHTSRICAANLVIDILKKYPNTFYRNMLLLLKGLITAPHIDYHTTLNPDRPSCHNHDDEHTDNGGIGLAFTDF